MAWTTYDEDIAYDAAIPYDGQEMATATATPTAGSGWKQWFFPAKKVAKAARRPSRRRREVEAAIAAMLFLED